MVAHSLGKSVKCQTWHFTGFTGSVCCVIKQQSSSCWRNDRARERERGRVSWTDQKYRQSQPTGISHHAPGAACHQQEQLGWLWETHCYTNRLLSLSLSQIGFIRSSCSLGQNMLIWLYAQWSEWPPAQYWFKKYSVLFSHILSHTDATSHSQSSVLKQESMLFLQLSN